MSLTRRSMESCRAEVADLQTHFVDLDDLSSARPKCWTRSIFDDRFIRPMANAISQFLEQVSRGPVVA